MKKYNKAFQGGAGAAVGYLIVWAIETFTTAPVPPGIDLAIAALLAGVFPVFGPANQE